MPHRRGADQMRTTLPLLFALLLACCGTDVRNVPLSDVDLSDMRAVRQLSRTLNPPERLALITYAAAHGNGSADCGADHESRDTAPPRTIGDAITVTLSRIASTRIDPANGDAPKPRQRFDQADRVLPRDRIIDRQSRLLADYGPAARKLPEWVALETKRAHLD